MNLSLLQTEFDDAAALYERSMQRLRICIASYENKIIQLSEKISKMEFEDCSHEFDEIEVVHANLAKVFFKYGFPLDGRLEFFVKEFDRIDDTDVRKFWHSKLSDGFKWTDDTFLALNKKNR